MPIYRFEDQQTIVADDDGWIAPSADLIGDVRLGRQASVWFGAVIRADNTPIVIGDRSNVQDGAVLHSDPDVPLTIGQDVTVGHRAILHGCTIEDEVLIGMGAIVLNRAVIGRGSLVGAGALVTEGKNFPAGSLILGSPARAVRSVTDDDRATIGRSADAYVRKARRFTASCSRTDDLPRSVGQTSW